MKSILSLLMFFIIGCGVKGKPLPPELPEHLGTGQYNYKNATETIKIKSKKANNDEEENEDEE